jgi:hypothetical protein
VTIVSIFEQVPILTTQPGRTLSDFRLLQKIGEGGMRVVWKAHDTKLDRDVALKLLPPELTADPERRRRFLLEARTAAAVAHPNIATIHEIDEVDGVTFIAMELVDGKTLRSVVGGHAFVAWPDLLPGGRTILLTDFDSAAAGSLVAVDLASRELEALGIEGSGARLLPTGHLVYANADASLMAVPFDARTLRATGSPVALLNDIALARIASPAFAFSADGTFVHVTDFLRGSARVPRRLVRATRTGATAPLSFEPELFSSGLALSPDGEHLAVGTWGGSLWVLDLERGTRAKLPSAGVDAAFLRNAWAPDGRRLAIPGRRGGAWGIYVQDVDGMGPLETLVEPTPGECRWTGWTPDGGTLVYARTDSSVSKSVFLRLDAQRAPPTVLWETAGLTSGGAISPDGRFVALESNASGDFEVYAAPLSGEGGRVTVSDQGGWYPVWARRPRAVLQPRTQGDGGRGRGHRAGAAFRPGAPPLRVERWSGLRRGAARGVLRHRACAWRRGADERPAPDRLVRPGRAAGRPGRESLTGIRACQ